MLHDVARLLSWFLTAITDYKVMFERSLGFCDDAIHIYVGVCIQLMSAQVLRVSIRSWRPLCAVLIVESINEVIDIRHDVWPSPAMQLGESLKDMILTVALPAAFLAVARLSPQILTGRAAGEERPTSSKSAESEDASVTVTPADQG